MASRLTGAPLSSVEQSVELAAAYADCRAIARREAKNFYYGFMALPRAKSDAMCAMYAFMRRADDISDDESLSLPERRAMLARWVESFRAQTAENTSDRAVFTAVRDVQRRFGIADELLEELVQGTAMDLLPEPPAGVSKIQINGRSFDVYDSIQALEQYCYLVASVVGLVTIRIFGYKDKRANEYAVDLGKAFQFTNILRDVKEDAQRGRIYLPAEVLQAHDASAQQIVAAAGNGQPPEVLRAAMQDLGERAERLYAAEQHLVPLLDRDSQPAMQVLISIYHSLLKEIKAANYEVFAQRLRVSTAKKVAILLRGMFLRLVQH